MVLEFPDGSPCSSTSQLFADEVLEQVSQRFLSNIPAPTSPGCRQINVLQGELARIGLSGPAVAVSSDGEGFLNPSDPGMQLHHNAAAGATTCCIALAVDVATDAVALTHLDGHIDVEPTLSLLIQVDIW